MWNFTVGHCAATTTYIILYPGYVGHGQQQQHSATNQEMDREAIKY